MFKLKFTFIQNESNYLYPSVPTSTFINPDDLTGSFRKTDFAYLNKWELYSQFKFGDCKSHSAFNNAYLTNTLL